MYIVLTIIEFSLYIAFSLLIGFLLLTLISEKHRPEIPWKRNLLLTCAAVIPVFAFFPVWQTVRVIAERNLEGNALLRVLTSTEIGQLWIILTLLSVILLFLILGTRKLPASSLAGIALFVIGCMIFAYTKTSHAASLAEWQGHIIHMIHFLAVTVWVGILLVVSWFAKSTANWSAFLKWFTPVAIVCLVAVVGAGIGSMSITIDSPEAPNSNIIQDYQNSLAIDYGQALLFKNLLTIGIVLFAVINGIMFRKRNEDPTFNPLKWTKAESVYLLFVFALSGFISHGQLPHSLDQLIRSGETSSLYTSFSSTNLMEIVQAGATPALSFSFGWMSLAFFGIGALFLIVMLGAATRRSSVVVSSLSGILMVISLYFGVMNGI
ncbi:hypothetical protein EQV77_17550 [Halobacillus fulvus]|nr:hypothetical protein EQV77_17550 [Halobacillus fulvus]